MRSGLIVTAIAAVAVSFLAGGRIVLADDTNTTTVTGAGSDINQQNVYKGPHKGWNKDEMQKLKAENPEKYKQVIEERRAKSQERLEYLKQHDPEKYREVMGKIRERRQERMEELKAKNPDEYKKIMEQRKATRQERLEKLKTEDPQKYQEIMARRQKMEEIRQLREMKQQDPAKFAQYLKDHPDAQQKLDQARKQWQERRAAPANSTVTTQP